MPDDNAIFMMTMIQRYSRCKPAPAPGHKAPSLFARVSSVSPFHYLLYSDPWGLSNEFVPKTLSPRPPEDPLSCGPPLERLSPGASDSPIMHASSLALRTKSFRGPAHRLNLAPRSNLTSEGEPSRCRAMRPHPSRGGVPPPSSRSPPATGQWAPSRGHAECRSAA